MTCETTIHQKFSVVIINTSADRSNLPELSQPSPLSVIADSRNPSLDTQNHINVSKTMIDTPHSALCPAKYQFLRQTPEMNFSRSLSMLTTTKDFFTLLRYAYYVHTS